MRIKELISKLIKLNSTPGGIALGVSIGVFIAITPLYGFHTLMVIIAAFLVPGVNKIAILLGTNVSLPPTLPFITWGGYEIGRFILRKNYPPLDYAYFSHITFQAAKDLYYPLFIGSLILGVFTAVIFYFIALIITKRIYRKRHINGK